MTLCGYIRHDIAKYVPIALYYYALLIDFWAAKMYYFTIGTLGLRVLAAIRRPNSPRWITMEESHQNEIQTA
jgi:hypothetical protein